MGTTLRKIETYPSHSKVKRVSRGTVHRKLEKVIEPGFHMLASLASCLDLSLESPRLFG